MSSLCLTGTILTIEWNYNFGLNSIWSIVTLWKGWGVSGPSKKGYVISTAPNHDHIIIYMIMYPFLKTQSTPALLSSCLLQIHPSIDEFEVSFGSFSFALCVNHAMFKSDYSLIKITLHLLCICGIYHLAINKQAIIVNLYPGLCLHYFQTWPLRLI